MRNQPSWTLHFLKLENTTKEGALPSGFRANPGLVDFCEKVKQGEPHWFKMIDEPLWRLFLQYHMVEYIQAMEEHAPDIHRLKVRSLLRPYLGHDDRALDRAGLRSDKTIVRLFIGRLLYEDVVVCYLEELLDIKRRLSVVTVEIPGHRLWLKCHEVWVPRQPCT